jgi:hypothetical protein
MSTAAPLQAASAKPTISSRSLGAKLLQRKCACGSSKSPLGEMCDECQSRVLQRKLAVGPSDDPLEQEADRIADQVMVAPAHLAVSTAPPRIQRLTEQPAGQTEVVPASVDHVLGSPGKPLEPALRQDMEQRFGHDFSRVRVHSGAAAEQSARDVNAHAYTVGHNIVFGAGRFSPGTYGGRRLMAHELAHVIQQEPSSASRFRASSSAPTMVYRQVGSGGSGSSRRIVYLDNDVVGAVVDGNKPVAEALMKMRASGTDVRITRYNYVETTHGEPIRAGARRLVIEKLAITIDEGGGFASRRATYIELSSGKPAAVQPKDVPMLAAVRAAGPDAELWSLDGGPKQNAKRFGVRLAPESSLAQVKTPLDVRVGLDNVGLQAYEIAADGTPIRRGQLLPGKAVASGKAPSDPKGGPPTGEKGGLPPETHAPKSPMDVHQGGMPEPASPPIESPFPGSGMPEPVPEPKPGFWKRVSAGVKTGVKTGLKAAFRAGNIAEIVIPELILRAADIAAAREAIRRIQIKFTKEGFAKGVAASLVGWTEEELHLNLMYKVDSTRLQGLEDPGGLLTYARIFQLAEAYENYAVYLGYEFSSSRSPKWRNDMRAKGFAVLAKRNYYFGEDPQVLSEYYVIDHLAYALSPITNSIVDKLMYEHIKSKIFGN